MNNTNWHKSKLLYRRLFILSFFCLSLLLTIQVFPLIWDLIVVIIISIILMYVFRPGVEFLESYGAPRSLAIIGLFAVAFTLFYLMILFFIPVLLKEIGSLTERVQEVNIRSIYSKIIDWIYAKIPAAQSILRLDENQIDIFINKISGTITGFLTKSFQLVADAANFLMLTFVVPFLTFFLLKDGPNFSKVIIAKIPNRFFEMSLSLAHRIDDQLGAYIRTIIVESLIIWIMTWASLSILGVRFSLLLGMINGLLNAIPFIGPVIAYVPIGLIILITYSPAGWGLLWMAIILFAIQMIDNFLLKPIMISNAVPVHPGIVLIAVLIGGRLAGVIGMFIAVPVVAIIQVIGLDLYTHLKNYRII